MRLLKVMGDAVDEFRYVEFRDVIFRHLRGGSEAVVEPGTDAEKTIPIKTRAYVLNDQGDTIQTFHARKEVVS